VRDPKRAIAIALREARVARPSTRRAVKKEHRINSNRRRGHEGALGPRKRGCQKTSVTFNGHRIGSLTTGLEVFDSFYQVAEYMTRKVGGLGLGWLSCAGIVEAHGGAVSVSRREGSGAFYGEPADASGRLSLCLGLAAGPSSTARSLRRSSSGRKGLYRKARPGSTSCRAMALSV